AFDQGHYRPYGNPGPGYISKIAKWNPRKRTAVYRWDRECQSWGYYGKRRHGDPIPTLITVPEEKLFNVSGYVSGDFRQFYVDPRTRAHYLQWAPFLLAAEEYHAGNMELGDEKLKKKGRKT